MPLKKGKSKSAVSENIREFHTGKTYAHTAAKFGKKDADKQAIAAALSTARRSRKYAEGGDVLPDIGDPAIGDGGQFSEGTRLGNKAADIGSKLGYGMMTGAVTSPYHIAKNMVEGSQESMQDGVGELSPKSIQGSGDLVMQGVEQAAGVRPGGASLASGPSYGDGSLIDWAMAQKAKKAHPDYLDFEQMGNGKYEVFDPVSGKTHATVNTEAEAKALAGDGPPPQSAGDKFRQYAKNIVADPREYARVKGGYTEPAYRGLHIDEAVSGEKVMNAKGIPEKDQALYWKNLSQSERDKMFADYRNGMAVGPNSIHNFTGEEYGHMYSTANPDLADMYAGALTKHPGRIVPPNTFPQGATVAPLYVNPKDYHYYNADGGNWQVHNDRAIKEAVKQGKKGVIVDNVWDEPGSTKNLTKPNKVYITFASGAPTVKSKFASKFDPTSADMLRARTGLSGGLPIDTEEKAGGGGVGDTGTYDRAKRYIRGMNTMSSGKGTWSGKSAEDQAREQTQDMADDIRSPRPPISYAAGGQAGNFNPERGAAFGLAKEGMINSSVPGRTDKLNLNVPTGSYVIPSDIVSALGQGNSAAGDSILGKMMTKGPYGMNLPKSKGPRIGARHTSMRPLHFAEGGGVGVTPIVAAGGEYLVHPQDVAALGNGDINLGHSILDAFVKHIRAKHIKTLKGLPGPKGSK